MASNPNFAVRLSKDEKNKLINLANLFHRSQSDILRLVITEAVVVLETSCLQGSSVVDDAVIDELLQALLNKKTDENRNAVRAWLNKYYSRN